MLLQVVVATEVDLEEAVRLDSYCHGQGIAFIRAEIRGLCGSVFCDFGKEFRVNDVDGMETCIFFC